MDRNVVLRGAQHIWWCWWIDDIDITIFAQNTNKTKNSWWANKRTHTVTDEPSQLVASSQRHAHTQKERYIVIPTHLTLLLFSYNGNKIHYRIYSSYVIWFWLYEFKKGKWMNGICNVMAFFRLAECSPRTHTESHTHRATHGCWIHGAYTHTYAHRRREQSAQHPE